MCISSTYLHHRRLRILWRACAVARLWWVWAAAPGSRRSYYGEASSDPYWHLKRQIARRRRHRHRRPSGSCCAPTTGVARFRRRKRWRRRPAESSNSPYLVTDGTNWTIRDGCRASGHAGTRWWASGPSSVWPPSVRRSRHRLLNTYMLHMYKRDAPSPPEKITNSRRDNIY